MFKKVKMVLALWALLLGQQGSALALVVYDVASDFSFVSNPNGPWSYGYETVLGGSFATYGAQSTINGMQTWSVNPFDLPSVSFNPTASDITFAATTLLAGHVNLHPGANNEVSVIRFTAPVAGTYSLSGDFNMRSFSPFGTNSTDVHVVLGNNIAAQLFGNGVTVSGFGDSSAFSTTLVLNASDFVDFAVGPNGTVPFQSYLGDTTQLNARFELNPNTVPEPNTFFLAAMGIGFLVLRQQKKR